MDYKKRHVLLSEEQLAKERAILLELNREPYSPISNYEDLFLKETGLFHHNSLEYKLLKCNKREDVLSLLKLSQEDIKKLRHLDDFSTNTRFSLINTILGVSDLIRILFTNKSFENILLNKSSNLSIIYEINEYKEYDNNTYPFEIDFNSKIIKRFFKETMSFLPSIKVIQENEIKCIPLNRLGFNDIELKYMSIPYHKSIYEFIDNNIDKLNNIDKDNKDLEVLNTKLEILNLYSRKYFKEFNNEQGFNPKIRLLSLVGNR